MHYSGSDQDKEHCPAAHHFLSRGELITDEVNVMKKYRIGLVGFAHMHVLGQIKPFLSMPERVEWIGASDIKPMVESEYFESSSRSMNLKLCQEQCGFTRVFEDYRDLFNKYDTLTKISFDYAVVEKEQSIQVFRYRGDWKDVGTWNMMAEVMADQTKGRAILDETCVNTNIVNELNIPILCMGCKDMIVAASGDGILISDKERSGYMKPYVEKIEIDAMYAEKSWGSYTVIDVQPGSMTVKLSMRVGESLSYHYHNHREEVWTVVSGKGKAMVDGMEQILRTGDVITISAGCKHTVQALTTLDIIEVQLGAEISAHDTIKVEM